MKIRLVAALVVLTGLASCSEADAQKSPKAEAAEEVSLVGYWESSRYKIAGKPMYLQFNQEGTATHNMSYRSRETRWMINDKKNMIIFTTSPNDQQFKCVVEIRPPATLLVVDAGCLPEAWSVDGLKGEAVYYFKQ